MHPVPDQLPKPDQGTPLRALLVFESMFGNTEEVARGVAAGLTAGGFIVESIDVVDVGPAETDAYELVVVGAPTHAFSLSRPSTRQDAVTKGGRPAAAATGLREWIATLPARGTPHGTAAAFDTRVTAMRRLPKAAATRAYHLLAHLGFEMVSRPTGFLVTDITGDLVPGETERAEAWGRLVADEARARSAAAVHR